MALVEGAEEERRRDRKERQAKCKRNQIYAYAWRLNSGVVSARGNGTLCTGDDAYTRTPC